MLIDTHSHLNDSKYDDAKLNEIISNMTSNNLEKIISVSASIEDSKEVVDLVSKYKNVYGVLGIHPENIKEVNEDNLKLLEELAKNKKIVAIGEIGLDYHYEGYNRQQQIDGFLKQVKLASKLNLPIVIHLRDAYEDMLNLLKENKEYLKNGFVIHCFSGSLEICKELLKLGAMFSFTGNITFKNARKAIEVIEFLPLNKIMVETDCPYLSPEPVRGTINEPKNVNYVFNKISEIKNIDKLELDKIIRENVREFYKI